jgi:putative oxidoreductase
MTRWLNRLQPWGVFFLRVVLGVAMVVHGYPKVVPPGAFHTRNAFSALDHYTHYIGSLGLPPWLGYVSAFTEFVGGLCLILGLLTRFFAFLVTINMLVAIAAADVHRGYASCELPLALAAIAFMILLTGPGKANLDRKTGFS